MNELLSLVYHYYPRECSFTSREYKTASEYSRYLNIVNDIAKRTKMEKKLFPNIVECADGYCVMQREHSDYSNYPSVQYTVLLHKNYRILDDDVDLILSLDGKRFDLELYFSLLGDYYYYYITETVGGKDTSAWNFSVLADEQLPYQERELVNLLCAKASTLGFKLLDNSLAHMMVPEVETELVSSGNATFFNCIFTDMKTRYY